MTNANVNLENLGVLVMEVLTGEEFADGRRPSYHVLAKAVGRLYEQRGGTRALGAVNREPLKWFHKPLQQCLQALVKAGAVVRAYDVGAKLYRYEVAQPSAPPAVAPTTTLPMPDHTTLEAVRIYEDATSFIARASIYSPEALASAAAWLRQAAERSDDFDKRAQLVLADLLGGALTARNEE